MGPTVCTLYVKEIVMTHSLLHAGHRILSQCFVCPARYFKSHTLLVEQRLQKDKLPEVVRESDACLR